MYLSDLYQEDDGKKVDIINSKSTSEKIELLMLLAMDIIDEKENIKTFIKHDEGVRNVYNLTKNIRDVYIDEKIDIPALLFSEQVSKAYDDRERMKEAGFVFK